MKVTIGKVLALEILNHISGFVSLSACHVTYIYAELFHKIKFCCTSKNVEHEHDFNTYVLLDSHSSIIYPIFFQAKALMTSQVNT